jgi:tetratricopeptide (TPR) repeat protein
LGRVVASLVCLAAMGWMGSQISRLWPEQYALDRTVGKVSGTAKELELLKRAYAAEPKNPQTPYRIGEFLRKESWMGLGDYEKKAREAIVWFEKAMALNPYDPHGFLGKGLCLDWLGKTDEGWVYFRQAMLLDPDSYFTRAYYGWHFYQLRDYLKARHWFQQSMNVRPDNPIAKPYMELIFRRIEEEEAAKAKGAAKITEPGLERAK